MAIAQDFNAEFNCEFDTNCSKGDPSVPKAVVVFPNPCEDEFYIKYKDSHGILTTIKGEIDICLVDVTGRFLMKSTHSRIDVGTLASGFYTALVKVNNQIFCIKFIKI